VFDETEHISRTVRLESGGTLRLRSFSGTVTITAADRSDVVIDAVRRGTRERLNRVTLDVHMDGSNVPLTLRNSSRRSVRAELGGRGGGSLRFKTFSGSVRIDR
jgi:hypothetical protein